MQCVKGLSAVRNYPVIGLSVEADTLTYVEGEMMDSGSGKQSVTPPASETTACISGFMYGTWESQPVPKGVGMSDQLEGRRSWRSAGSRMRSYERGRR